jgi:L,D-transpeptidase-like protein/putative peptidoglycan binding protein
MGSGSVRRGLAAVIFVAAATLAVPTPAEAAGASGVAALQVALRARGLYTAAVDGLLGPKTVAAVRVFQRRRDLVVDGIPGPQTRAALGRYGRFRLGERILYSGEYGWDVAETQFLLRRRGFHPGALDGRFGDRTRASLRRFQRQGRLTPDGIVGPRTLAALDGRSADRGAGGLTRDQSRDARSKRRLVVIRRRAHRLYLYRRGSPVRVFAVATGSPRAPTPGGHLRIVWKQRHPWWYPPKSPWAKGLHPIPPGPGNPLGTRWMGLSAPGVGIHGTPDSISVGYAVSHGCVRMAVRDAEWLYRHVRVGTPVWIF